MMRSQHPPHTNI